MMHGVIRQKRSTLRCLCRALCVRKRRRMDFERRKRWYAGIVSDYEKLFF